MKASLLTAGAAVAACAAALPAQVYSYQATDLGVVPGQSPLAGVGCASISNDGTRIGGTSVWEPYVWTAGTGMLALAKAPGFPNAEVFDVNDLGQAAGSVGMATLSYPTTAAYWQPSGAVQLIPGLGGNFSWAVAINAGGTVVGTSDRPGTIWAHAFAWTAAGGTVDLTPGLAGPSFAIDLNDAGQVCIEASGTCYRLDPGAGLQGLGTFSPFRMNEYGQIAGRNPAGVLARYTDGTGWDLVGTGAPFQLSHIDGFNGHGQVAGTRSILLHNSPPSYQRIGYLWTDGLGFQKLDDLIHPSSQVVVDFVGGITDDGRIAAWGSIGPDNRAFLLEPRFVHEYGSGCAPAGARVPKLAIGGVPTGGQSLAFLGAAGHGSGVGIGVFALSLASGNSLLPSGCAALVDMTAVHLVAEIENPIGQARFVLPLPPGVPQTRLYAQYASLDLSAGLGSLAMSNALHVDEQ